MAEDVRREWDAALDQLHEQMADEPCVREALSNLEMAALNLGRVMASEVQRLLPTPQTGVDHVVLTELVAHAAKRATIHGYEAWRKEYP